MVMLVLAAVTVAEAGEVWERVRTEIDGIGFNCVVGDRGDSGTLYAGTDEGVYKSADGGRSWWRAYRGWQGRARVRAIIADGRDVLAATDKGLVVSGNAGKSWRVSSGIAGQHPISSVAAVGGLKGEIFIATPAGIYRSGGEKGERVERVSWRRVFAAGDADDVRGLQDEGVEEVALFATSVAVWSGKVFAAAKSGIHISEDGGESFRRFTDAGLFDRGVTYLSAAADSDRLYAVTGTEIFYYDGGERWNLLESARGLRDVGSIDAAAGSGDDGAIWIATEQGIYKMVASDDEAELVKIEVANIISDFDCEPSINEVQDRAIRYAEVHPGKISEWRMRANLSSILPRFSLGIDNDESQSLHWDAGQNPDVWVTGPESASTGWDMTFTWDLNELIWNGDQTQIDVRSKLMVQLRDDVLDEVTSYYYERRKLQIELMSSPPSGIRGRLNKELRIQELASNLDALTGGYFTEAMERRAR